MNYTKLAEQLLENMILANKSKALLKLSKIIHGEMFALQMIAAHNNDITPGDISKAAGTSPARIAAELKSLENKGLIIREIDPNNSRRILIHLTPEGEKTANTYHCEGIDVARELISQLGESDAIEYIRIIGKLGEIQNDKDSAQFPIA